MQRTYGKRDCHISPHRSLLNTAPLRGLPCGHGVFDVQQVSWMSRHLLFIKLENASMLGDGAADKLSVAQHGFVDTKGKGTCLSMTAVFQVVQAHCQSIASNVY